LGKTWQVSVGSSRNDPSLIKTCQVSNPKMSRDYALGSRQALQTISPDPRLASKFWMGFWMKRYVVLLVGMVIVVVAVSRDLVFTG
jgi:hypothetical protein